MSRSRPEVVAFDVNETLLDLAPVRGRARRGRPAAGAAADGLRPHAADRLRRRRHRHLVPVPRRLRRRAGPGERPRRRASGPRSPTPSASSRRTRTSSRRCAGWPRPASGWSPSPTAPPASPRPGSNGAGSRRWSSARCPARSIRAWKPAREVYLWAAGQLRVAPERMALVAAHGWDVHGAQRAGLTGAWFPRSERSYPAVYEEPHVAAADLAGAVDALLALPRRMTEVREIATPLGPARAHVTEPDGAARGTLVLGHGAGGGIESADLVAVTAAAAGRRLAGGPGRAAVAGGRQADRARPAAAGRGLAGGARPPCAPTDLADRPAGARRPQRRGAGGLPDGGRAGRGRRAGAGLPAAPAGQAGEEPRAPSSPPSPCRWSSSRARPTRSARRRPWPPCWPAGPTRRSTPCRATTRSRRNVDVVAVAALVLARRARTGLTRAARTGPSARGDGGGGAPAGRGPAARRRRRPPAPRSGPWPRRRRPRAGRSAPAPPAAG